jgi:hypothetical protein
MDTQEHQSARRHTSIVATLRRLLPYVAPAWQPLLLAAGHGQFAELNRAWLDSLA